MKKVYNVQEQLKSLGYDSNCKCSWRVNLYGHVVQGIVLNCSKHNDMKKLVKMLQHAHAGETAAYFAYEGHIKSVRDSKIKEAIRKIQKEESDHIQMTWLMLHELGAKPSPWQDLVFTVIGKTLSVLCRVTGYFAPMYGALLIEKVGVNNYKAMAQEARSKRLFAMHAALVDMKNTEEEHEKFFRTCLGQKAEFDQ